MIFTPSIGLPYSSSTIPFTLPLPRPAWAIIKEPAKARRTATKRIVFTLFMINLLIFTALYLYGMIQERGSESKPPGKLSPHIFNFMTFFTRVSAFRFSISTVKW